MGSKPRHPPLIRLPMAIFWHGFAYSINYSLGFILIEETHTTLATKQHVMIDLIAGAALGALVAWLSLRRVQSA